MRECVTDYVRMIQAPKLLVVGDLILDRYVWGTVRRVSPEAPVLVLEANNHEARLGGAASVAWLLQTLGARVSLAGVVGDDVDGEMLLHLLDECHVSREAVLTVPGRVTTSKERLMGRVENRQPHPVLRVDREVCSELGTATERRCLDLIEKQIWTRDAVLLSDYAKGVCTPGLVSTMIAAAGQRQIPLLVDPGRGVDCDRYAGAEALLPNRSESEAITGSKITTPQEAVSAAQEMVQRYNLGCALVKLDSDGMIFVNQAGEISRFPTASRAVHDVTGAGDIVLAVVGICRAAQVPWDAAIQLANVAAGLEVERLGVSPVTWDEIREHASQNRPAKGGEKMATLMQIGELAQSYRSQGRKVVMTNGCFDLLHPGHISSLEEAAELGDVLIVAINSDASARRLKGPQRPVMEEIERARMLAALQVVDHVLIFDEDTPLAAIQCIRPDVLVKGGGYATDEVVGREIVLSYGGEVRVTSNVAGLSTTNILDRVAKCLQSEQSRQ